MRKTLWTRWKTRAVFVMALCLCLLAVSAGADGVMPRMPAPPDVPVYWQLTRIDQEREATPAGGYAVEDMLHGLTLDLTDGLLMESVLESDGDGQGLSLIIDRDDTVVMEHTYLWTPLPIYMEPDTDYPIDVTGTSVTGGATPNTLLGVYTQGDYIGRISAGAYTGHAAAMQFVLNTNDIGIYKDGSFVVSIILRDVNDMYRNRLVFTYEMHDGVRPHPTPVPGFVATELPEDVEVPAYYVRVRNHDGLWQIVTAPDQYRAFGVMTGAGPYFFPADAEGNVVMNETPADPQADFDTYVKGFIAEKTDDVPAQYTVLPNGRFELTTRDGETITRAFGRMDGGEPAFYPVGEDGRVAEDATPVDPAQDFDDYVKGFGAAEPQTIPAHYQAEDGGVYAFTGRDGVRRYRVYGRLDGAEPAFYPADAQGTLEGEQPPAIEPESDFELYIKGFDPVTPPEVPDFYTSIGDDLYVVTDREGNPVYRVYGVKDGAEPAFYPTDENGAVSEDAQPVATEDDFETHIAGFEAAEPQDVPFYYEPTAVPGVWAFIDKQDNEQYRAYGSLHRTEPAFYPSDVEGNVASDALPVQPASDLALMPPPVFTPAAPQTVPAHYQVVPDTESLYAITDMDGEKVYRAYGFFGRMEPTFYPSDETGEVSPASSPADPDEDYAAHFSGFVPQTPQADKVPAYYAVVGNAYRFIDLDGKPVYRVFGAKEGAEPAFYPADENGRVISGEPVDPDAEHQTYFGDIVAQTPETVPAHYEVVDAEKGLYRFTDLDGNDVYRVYGGKESATPAFYPADAEGKLTSGEAVDTEKEHAEAFEAFVIKTPEATAIPEHYVPVEGVQGLYTFEDKQGRPVFRIFGSASAEGEDGAFYPADVEGNIQSARVVDPAQDAELLPLNTQLKVSTPQPAAEISQTPLARTHTFSTATPIPFVAGVSTTGPSAEISPAVTRMITASPEATATAMPGTILSAITQQPPLSTGTPESVTRLAGANAEEAATPEATQAATQAPTETAPAETAATPEPAATQEATQAPTPEPTEPAPEETPATPEPTEPAPVETAAPTPQPEPEPQGLSTGAWIAIVAGAVIVIGAIAFFVLRKRKELP